MYVVSVSKSIFWYFVHTGSALRLFYSAARHHDNEPSRVAAEANDEGVSVVNVSPRGAAQGN